MKYIFLILLLIIFVAPLRRFLFYLLVGRAVNKQQKRYNDMMENQMRREGEIKVDKKPRKSDENKGYYVDYEEVKD
jgi:hypothetical protein